MIAESLLKLAAIEQPTHPFPGLRPFEFHENHLFFGRDGQSEQLIAKLGGTRFVAVVGTSGSGKSSLVRAGFLPALFGGLMSHAGSGWRAAIMRPGNDPIGNLARALNADGVLGDEDPPNTAVRLAMTEAILRRGSLGLIEAFRQGELAVNENLLVLVDQFEELFRVEAGSEDNEKAAFVKLLLEAKDQRELSIYVVLTIRSDYLGDCAQFRDLPEAINQGQYLIPRMTREERRASITGPVAVGGAAIAPRLVNRLLNEVGDNPDQLPILQHALMRTWDRWNQDARGDEPIDLRHYEAIGGLSEALSLHADEACDELPESRRALAERIFRSLTEKGRDNREVRRPLTVRDICTVTSADEPEVIAVVETFRRVDRSFLMPSAEVGLTADSLIDISHESLIRNWKRLKAWVEDEAQSAAIYRRLAETAVLHGEGGAGLWRDPDLQIALDWREHVTPNAAWAQRYHPRFAEANGFLEESLALREAEAREKRERRRRELTRIRIFAEILGLAFLISAGLALYGNQKRIEALQQTDLAIQQRKVAEERERSNRQLFYVAQMNFAQKAFAEGDSGRGNEHLNTALPTAADAPRDDMRGFGWYLVWRLHHHEKATLAGHAGRVSSVAFAPDGKTLASGSQEGTVKLWDVATRRALARLEGGAGNVASIAFAPDGRVLAVGSTDGTIKLWDVATRQQVATLKGHGKWVTSVVFSPDGKTLASGAKDGAAKLWDLAGTHQALATFRGPSDWVNSVAFAPNGKTLASASDDGTVKLWDVVTGQALATFKGHPDGVFSVAFTPDGKALAAGSADGAVHSWDVRTGQDLATFAGHAGAVLAVVPAPDGKILASGSEDGTVKLWDMETRGTLATLEGHADVVYSVAFAPDGKTLASGSEDGTVKLWEKGKPRSPATSLEGHTGDVFAVVFAPNGKRLASASGDGTVRLWETGEIQAPATPLEGHTGNVFSVAFAPDGKMLASGGQDGAVKLWDTDTRQTLATLEGKAGEVSAVAFSPDGKILAAGGWGGVVKLWNVRKRQALATLEGHEYGVSSVVFAPNGKTLAAGSYGGTVKLWAVHERRVPATPLEGHTRDVLSVAFSPDGGVVASGSSDNTIRLWDVATGKALATLKGHTNTVNSAAFASDGKALASASLDGTVKIWHVDTRQTLVTLKGHTGEVYSVAFAPDGKTLASGGEDKTVRLYYAATEEEVRRQRGLALRHDE